MRRLLVTAVLVPAVLVLGGLGVGALSLVGTSGDDGTAAGTEQRLFHGGPGPDELILQDLGAGSAQAAAFGRGGDDFVSAFPTSYAGGSPTPVALLSGGRGNDSLTGYARALDGGSGDDSIRTFELGQPLVSTVRCGAGVDTLRMDRQLAGPLDYFGDDCERVEVWIWSTVAGDQVLGGTEYDDLVRTVSNAPGGGDDTIRSYAGDDRVQGDWGSDTAYLGAGDDYYSDVSTHARDDVDRVSCGAGHDEVRAYRSDVVASDCELVRYWE